MDIELGLSLDDLLLIPRKSSINSRFDGEIDLQTELVPGVKLKYGLISANMDTISGLAMVQKMNNLGGTGICHRFMTIDKHKEILRQLKSPVIGCIGVGDNGKRRAEQILPLSDAILIDVAHGHSNAVGTQITWLQHQSKIPIIAGNVATAEGADFLFNQGIQALKTGVGCGAICSTRLMTGCGVPQATAIIDAVKARDKYKYKATIIADGGIKNSGDVVKCLALGADTVMIGNLLAGTTEAPGKIVYDRGIPKKMYRGLASRDAQESWKGAATSVEGETTYVPFKGDVERIFKDLIAGILSGMSYQDARNLKQLRDNAKFIRQTAAGRTESSVRV